MIKTKKQMFIIIGVFTLVMMLGTVTFAFFNYTRTGTANVIRTGQINFSTSQDSTLTLTNVFPVESSSVGNDYTQDTLSIAITGDTTYDEGIEYLVTAEEVNVETSTGKKVPLTLKVDVTDDLGTEDESDDEIDYFTDREDKDTSYYKILSESVLYDGQYLLVGYIAPDSAGGEIDGTINIKAYLDKSKIGISDTYPEGVVHTVKTTGYSSNDCETALTGVTNASTYCATAADLQEAIDGDDLTSAQVNALLNAGIVEEYTDGTPASFGTGRTVLTTTEWNSLQTAGNELSFKVRIEANEGIWVEEAKMINSMNRIPSSLTSGITEIYFIKETPMRMEARYNAASVKADVTDTTLNEGKVLAWQENGKLYIASAGETYLPQDSGGYFAGLMSVTKIEFENINTSRVTSMAGMFSSCGVYKLDLRSFDTSNVTSMDGMVLACPNLTEVNASGLGSDYLNDMEIGVVCQNLKKIDMSNFNFGLLTSLSFPSSAHPSLEEVNLQGAIMDNFTSFSDMFFGLTTLKVVNLSDIDTSSITNMSAMFKGASALETVYVSNTWNTNSVTNSDNMFDGCTSIVGGQGTTYDSSYIDASYAKIDGGEGNRGYFTASN